MTPQTAKHKLLEAALDLVLAKGYASTTVDQICEAAGASKGSFYHFFDSKEALGLAALDAYLERVGKRLDQGSHTKVLDPKERALAFVDYLVDVAGEVWGNGCLMGSYALDVVATNPSLRAAVSDTFGRVAESYAQAFAPALEQRGDDAEQRAHALAEEFVVAIEGGIGLAKAHQDWSYVTRALERFRRNFRREAGLAP